MSLKWKYGACGAYADYKGYIITLQDHPKLCKYNIEKENRKGDLYFIDHASTIEDAKEKINKEL